MDRGVASQGGRGRESVADAGVGVAAALEHLAEAYRFARQLAHDPWEFAVEMRQLLALGLTTSQLRWLSVRGYLQHGCEITGREDEHRCFDRSANLAFSAATCFVATEAGLKAAGERVPPALHADDRGGGACRRSSAADVAGAVAVQTMLPRWDRDRRMLYFDGQVVKQYRCRAANQEAILAAFQEENWPYVIDDPLAPLPEVLPKQRLNETIKALNAKQHCLLLRFRGDGTGQRVCWEPRRNGLRAAHGHRRAA